MNLRRKEASWELITIRFRGNDFELKFSRRVGHAEAHGPVEPASFHAGPGQRLERGAHCNSHGGIGNVDPGAAAQEIPIGISLEQEIQFRSGEFDGGFLVPGHGFVQAGGGILRGFDLGRARRFDANVGGRSRSEVLKSLLVEQPAADADNGDEQKSDDENRQTTLRKTSHAGARRRIISRGGPDRRNRRWWNHWRGGWGWWWASAHARARRGRWRGTLHAHHER